MSPKRERTIAGEAAGDSGRPPEKLVEAQVQTDLRESCYQAIRAVTCQLDRACWRCGGDGVLACLTEEDATKVLRRRSNGRPTTRW